MSTAGLQFQQLEPRPHGPRALRIALTVIGALIATGVIAAGAATLLDHAARHTFAVSSAYPGVRSLVVNAGGGDVHLTSAPAGAALTVVAHVTEGLQTPSRSATLDGAGVLHLKEGCNLWFGTECDVSYDIGVPSGVGVIATSGGDVIATDLTTSQPIHLSSGGGEIHATRLSSPSVKLDTGAGDVQAQLNSPPRNLEARSGAGDVTITVPDVAYSVHASSRAGSVSDSSLRIDPASSRRIDASSGAGDVTISPTR